MSGSLPSNIEKNPKAQANAVITRSGKSTQKVQEPVTEPVEEEEVTEKVKEKLEKVSEKKEAPKSPLREYKPRIPH
jgi:uncharacterized ferredoxin-like protein